MISPPAAPIDSAAVARRAKSNLAITLACLPVERRRDMTSFYAFCRIVDDIADEKEFSLKDRRIQLGAWRRIVRGEQLPADAVGREVVGLPRKYDFDPSLLEEIIDGVSMDLENRRYETFEDLRKYCYKVAGLVGLISLKIFGVTDSRAREYAINLGYALQLTNILRDVEADWKNDGRVYLPLEDLAAHGYTIDDVAACRYNDSFLTLMRFEAARAAEYFERAVASFPRHEAGRLQAAEAMRKIYHGILLRMQADGFKIYHRRYRLPAWRKAIILALAWWRGRRRWH
jgi:15-cis-phytoene synthase